MVAEQARYECIASVIKTSRSVGKKYFDTRGRLGLWDGKEMRCLHNRRRAQCKECGGSSICEHDKRRGECKVCSGTVDEVSSLTTMSAKLGVPLLTSVPLKKREIGQQYLDTKGNLGYWNGKDLRCAHHRERRYCKLCGGSQICPHNRVRAQCKDCGGSSICEHKRQRATCKECGGSQVCDHNRIKYQCKDCIAQTQPRSRSTITYCKHNRQKSRCTSCNPKKQTVDWAHTGVPSFLNLSNSAAITEENTNNGDEIKAEKYTAPNELSISSALLALDNPDSSSTVITSFPLFRPLPCDASEY